MKLTCSSPRLLTTNTNLSARWHWEWRCYFLGLDRKRTIDGIFIRKWNSFMSLWSAPLGPLAKSLGTWLGKSVRQRKEMETASWSEWYSMHSFGPWMGDNENWRRKRFPCAKMLLGGKTSLIFHVNLPTSWSHQTRQTVHRLRRRHVYFQHERMRMRTWHLSFYSTQRFALT